MILVDEAEFKRILSTLKIEETISGGSVANSIVGLSQLGNKVGFIGKVSDDDLGSKYEEGLKKENVPLAALLHFINSTAMTTEKTEPIISSFCFIVSANLDTAKITNHITPNVT